MNRKIIFFMLLALIFFAAREACAVDILEIRIKRLYKEAEELTKKGDYDEALEAYNKAISYAKDKDIRQFLMNAKKELQKKRRQKAGAFEMPPAEKTVSGVTPSEMKKKEYAPPAEEARPKEESAAIAEEKARLEEERAKLEAEKKKFEEEKTSLAAEKIRAEQAERQAKLEEEEKAKEAEEERQALEKEETEKKVEAKTDIEETAPQGEEETADLEKRKEREAKDRAIYESSTYRYKVKQILDKAYNKFKETTVKVETDEMLERVGSKLSALAALDSEAEGLMAQGQYEKAQDVYKKILDMSKDPDLKAYIKRQKGD